MTQAPRQWLGDTLGLVAAVLWGATSLVIRGSRLANAPPEQTLVYQLGVSGVLLTAASLLLGETWPAWSSLGLRPLLLLGEPLTLRLLVACAAVVLGIALVNRAPPTSATAAPR